MIKRILLAAPVSLALVAATPVLAQDDTLEAPASEDMGMDMMAGMGAMFGEMFKVEPLTAEQQARMPAATAIAAKILPDGTMSEMFEGMMSDLMGPLMNMGPPPASQTISRALGISDYELDLTDEQKAELAALIDPAWEERSKREAAVMPEVMGDLMSAMEPGMRKAMAELYAIKFDQGELTQLDAFFSTDLGAKFARESYAMATDKRMIGASLEMMPEMMGAIGDIKTKVDAATADLPAVREFSQLSAREKARAAALTGYSVEELEESAADASIGTGEWMEESADAVEESSN